MAEELDAACRRSTSAWSTGDPAQGLFTAPRRGNFPGASAANLTAAQNLYALLTGRVSAIDGDARLDENTDEYVYMGTGMQRARMREAGFFIQDSWRWKPNFTINVGLRYELQFPFYPLNSSYSTATLADLCGVSGVGSATASTRRATCSSRATMPGKRPQFINFAKGDVRLRHRLQQLRAERRLRLDARTTSRACSARCSGDEDASSAPATPARSTGTA